MPSFIGDNPLRQEKHNKLEQIRRKGFNPYPHSFKKSHSVLEAIEDFLQKEASRSFKPAVQNPEKSASFALSDASQKGRPAAVEESSDRISKEIRPQIYVLTGRIMFKRDMGKAAFFHIQDAAGVHKGPDGGGRWSEGRMLQCYIRKDTFQKTAPPAGSEERSSEALELGKNKPPSVTAPLSAAAAAENGAWDLWKLSDIGDIVGVRGPLFRTKKGELSLRVQSYHMLCKSLAPLPEKRHGLQEEDIKRRFRYLDLITRPSARRIFLTRAKILREIRYFMDQKGFIEMETPILQPLYGGAFAVPFKTRHRRLKRDLYLKISPEIYLKKILVGGFEKVFELGKNFRNEGIDKTHNPEFSMMEYYQAYTDYTDQMHFFEELVCHIVRRISQSSALEDKARARIEGLMKSAAPALEPEKEAPHSHTAKPSSALAVKNPENTPPPLQKDGASSLAAGGSAGDFACPPEASSIAGAGKSFDDSHEKTGSSFGAALRIVYQGKSLELARPWAKISLLQFEDLMLRMTFMEPADSVLGEKPRLHPVCFRNAAPRGGRSLKEGSGDSKLLDLQIPKNLPEHGVSGEKSFAPADRRPDHGSLSDLSRFWHKTVEEIRRQRQMDRWRVFPSGFWEGVQPVKTAQREAEKTGSVCPPLPLADRFKRFLALGKILDPQMDFRKFESALQHLVSLKSAPHASLKFYEGLKDELVLRVLELSVEKYFFRSCFYHGFSFGDISVD